MDTRATGASPRGDSWRIEAAEYGPTEADQCDAGLDDHLWADLMAEAALMHDRRPAADDDPPADLDF